MGALTTEQADRLADRSAKETNAANRGTSRETVTLIAVQK